MLPLELLVKEIEPNGLQVVGLSVWLLNKKTVKHPRFEAPLMFDTVMPLIVQFASPKFLI
jgi:hypothetical protein